MYEKGEFPTAALLGQHRALSNDFSLTPNALRKADPAIPQEEQIDPTLAALLRDQPMPPGGNPVARLMFSVEAPTLWPRFRESILEAWIRERPSTRPSCWWRFDAPKASDEDLAKFAGIPKTERIIDLRQKLSGDGVPIWEKQRGNFSHHRGIPDWFGSPDHPPIFESQHDYLARHGLLMPGELRSKEPPAVPRRIVDSTGKYPPVRRPPRRP